MSEHDEQVALFDYLALYETKHPELRWIHAIPNGGHRHPATAERLKREGVKAGIADIFVPYTMPTNDCGYVEFFGGLYIEMKFGKNKLTPEQKEFLWRMGSNGYRTAVCYSWQEAVNAIADYLEIPELKVSEA